MFVCVRKRERHTITRLLSLMEWSEAHSSHCPATCTYVTVYSILIYKVAIVNSLHLHYMEYIFIQILNVEFLEYLLSLLLPSCHKSIKPSIK